MPLTVYNEVTYGQPLYYGSVDPNSELLWSLEIDWLSNRTWGDGFNEAQHMTDLTVGRGRSHLMSSKGWEYVKPGKAIVTIDNADGRYDPYNTSSPLYGYIGPGKFARLKVLYDGTSIDVFAGMVADIQPYNRGRQRAVRITMVDGLQFLAERLTSRAVFNSTAFNHVHELAQNAGWPNSTETWYQATYGTDGQGGTLFFKTFWWKHNCIEAIESLLNAYFRAEYFHAADGNLAVIGPSYTYETVTAIDESECLADILVPQPWETVRNEASIFERKFIDTVSASEILWELQDPLPIQHGETLALDVLFSYQNYKPVGGRSLGTISFTANTASDGSGTDITANCTAIRDTASGEGTTIIFTNNSGQAGYIVTASLTGTGVYAPHQTVWTGIDTVSQARYGKKTFTLGPGWLNYGGYAKDYAKMVLDRFSTPITTPTIMLEKRPNLQFGKELFIDLITLTAPTMMLDAPYRIAGITHRWLNATGQHVQTQYYLEPYFGEI